MGSEPCQCKAWVAAGMMAHCPQSVMPRPETEMEVARLTCAASSLWLAVGGCHVIFCLPRLSVPDTSELGVAASTDPACDSYCWHLGLTEAERRHTASIDTQHCVPRIARAPFYCFIYYEGFICCIFAGAKPCRSVKRPTITSCHFQASSRYDSQRDAANELCLYSSPVTYYCLGNTVSALAQDSKQHMTTVFLTNMQCASDRQTHVASAVLLTSGWSDTSRSRLWGLSRGLGGGVGGSLRGGSGSEATADKRLHSGSSGPGGTGQCA